MMTNTTVERKSPFERNLKAKSFKWVFLLIVCAFGSTTIAANPLSDEERFDYCSSWSDFAALQMTLRQDGFPYMQAIESVKATARNEAEFDLAMAILQAAYNRELAPTYRLAEIAAFEFREYHFTTCMTR